MNVARQRVAREEARDQNKTAPREQIENQHERQACSRPARRLEREIAVVQPEHHRHRTKCSRQVADGNLWVSSNAGRAVGYSGVTVWNPAGKLIGRIRIPEIVGNRLLRRAASATVLFMAGSQSLYALYTATQGAAPG